jgi:hypothetical protein
MQMAAQPSGPHKLPQKWWRLICPTRQIPPLTRTVEGTVVGGYGRGEGSHGAGDSIDWVSIVESAREPLANGGTLLVQVSRSDDVVDRSRPKGVR